MHFKHFVVLHFHPAQGRPALLSHAEDDTFRAMRERCVIVLCVMAVAVGSVLPMAGASPIRDPKRSVNERTVDLNPLLLWWTNHNGSRPLVSWVQVTGPVVGTNSYGWVVEARVERTARNTEASSVPDSGSGKTRILLRHPPLQDRAVFVKLSQQLKVLNTQRSTLSAAESDAKSRRKAVDDAESYNRAYGVRSWGLAVERRQLQQNQSQVSAQLKVLDQQIQALKKLLSPWPDTDHYVVDCFALDVGQGKDGLPVFDYGLVVK